MNGSRSGGCTDIYKGVGCRGENCSASGIGIGIGICRGGCQERDCNGVGTCRGGCRGRDYIGELVGKAKVRYEQVPVCI